MYTITRKWFPIKLDRLLVYYRIFLWLISKKSFQMRCNN